MPDDLDDDDDNDGYPDADDMFPNDPAEWNDTDQDGIGNNIDPDMDGDGVNNTDDMFPLDGSDWLDTDGDNIGNNTDTDDDNDGIQDVSDAFPLDASRSQNPSEGGGSIDISLLLIMLFYGLWKFRLEINRHHVS